MSEVRVSEMLVRVLEAEGVKYIFTLSGGHIASVYDACLDHGIKLIDTRHEQAAVHMADGWARVTGGPGVALVTAGPGHANALPGLYVANEGGSPVVLISGQSQYFNLGMGAMQEMDQAAVAAPITKWARSVTDVRRIPEYMCTAFREALTGRPGPVSLSIPVDTLRGKLPEEDYGVEPPTKYRTSARAMGDPDLVKQAASILSRAARPVAIAGSGAYWSKAGLALKEFIEATGIPLFTVEQAAGLVPEDHPLSVGPASPMTNGAARKIRDADVVLLLGVAMNFSLGFGRPPTLNAEAKIVRVDLSPSAIGQNRGIDVGIIGDVHSVVGQLLAAGVRKQGDDSWVRSMRGAAEDLQASWKELAESNKVPIHPFRLTTELAKVLDRDATIVIDGGDIGVWGRISLPAYVPASRLGGGLGCGAPFAMAAKLARPNNQVVIVNGDGSFGLSAMEFDTAVRHNIPIVSVIGNDQAWGMIKNLQIPNYGKDRVVAAELGLRRYDKVVEALGGHGEFVERPEDIRPAIERALASGKPACVNVITECVTSPVTESWLLGGVR